MANEVIDVKCTKCGHVLKVKKPTKPGIFQFACPECSQQLKIQLRAKPLQLDPGKPADDNKKKAILLNDIVAVKEGVYAVKPKVQVNKPYAFRCPTCEKPVFFILPKAGVMGVKCSKCSTLTYVKAADIQQATAPTPTASKPEEEKKQEHPHTHIIGGKKNFFPGVLTWGNIFRRQKFELSEGSFVLGRKDSECRSDIEFNDSEMSRRSVVIDVEKRERGYFVKMTVERALNPVLHNNKPLAVSESIYLQYGDSIQLGRTVLHFQKNS